MVAREGILQATRCVAFRRRTAVTSSGTPRHTFGAALGVVEANAYKIQALLHHAHPATTARYARPNVNPLRVASEQAMAGLGVALKAGR